MHQRILITGSCGLVGSALRGALRLQGKDVAGLDIVGANRDHGDVWDPQRVRRAVESCCGIVHLAAVSRVIWGEQDPELCRATNVGGLRNVLQAAVESNRRPWLIFASSREVYGQPEHLPATEDTPLHAVNVYGHTKVKGERLVAEAQRAGLKACIIRLSNVFGSVSDHADRVVPAFARAAVDGSPLRVDGPDHTFDFTHIDDVSRGIANLAALLESAEAAPPPIHFVSGRPTTLRELAELAIDLAGSRSTIRLAPSRNFDVARFVGSPARATRILGWEPRVPLRDGLARLINDFRADVGGEPMQVLAR